MIPFGQNFNNSSYQVSAEIAASQKLDELVLRRKKCDGLFHFDKVK
jgi:hypothetical protein